ncbi:MAG: 3-hydroxyacyl-CoA dehydrogenase NAD-binding domain-containing protein [Candidatus Eremiobacteraeota bacterium]|nr:3-hydroxyacyl-CoA dehydrogenase NAD-binding domain-containing protein [Candidatus Eremiobacteraeota bacterium]
MSETILIAGGGTMGAGIAAVAAAAGYDVEVVEPDAAARARIVSNAQTTVMDAMPSRSEATIAIEAVGERLELKRATFAGFENALSPDALIASNTSSLSIDEISAQLQHPERALGLHFFNPPTKMALVEIVCADATSDEALTRAQAFIARLGKTSVVAEDTPGFIVNRVARPYYLQSMRALEAGVGPVEDLDALARGVGFRMGPFELMDLIGLDINLATSESIYARTGEERLAPVATQREMVAQGRLGRKSGAGFYDYASGPPVRDDAPPGPVARNEDENVVLLGYGGVADEIFELLAQAYEHVTRVESDELLDELPPDATIVIDIGDGASDRSATLRGVAATLGAEAVIFADAYATDLAACARNFVGPERLVGYGVLGALESQAAVEIVDTDAVSDDALELAQDVFESLGRRTILVEDRVGLFLGRVIASIVNEAVAAVDDGVATPDDVDTAMRLGTNYPIGPIAWGREIGGARLARILGRIAEVEGAAYAPHRALWVLDIDDEPQVAQP